MFLIPHAIFLARVSNHHPQLPPSSLQPFTTNNMGQDSEQAAEFVATVRGEHAAMKQWFNESAAAAELRAKYGQYPGLWKEVLNWAGWKEARKEYLKQSQTKEEQPLPRKRKSRWGSTDGADKRPSRWSSSTPGSANNGGGSSAALPLPNVPGLPANLPPHRQEEMRRLQSRLRQINDKLDNLEREAARVDALPRGHRDRSPSPPPGT